MSYSAFFQRLRANHDEFTRLHRGAVEQGAGFVRWHGTVPAFQCVLLDDAAAVERLPAGTRAVRTFPWSSAAVPALAARGFAPAGQIRYMTLPAGRAVAAAELANVEVTLAVDQAGLARFSDVQAGGFAAPGADPAPLRAFLHAANTPNLGHPAQSFLVASVDGTAAAVTLVVRHQGTAGIYAVATLPAWRRRGLSTLLLARAVLDARQAGNDVVTLQVEGGSDAERLYAHLGFGVEFDCQLWALPAG